jgi:hypothetical protein
MFWLGFIVFAAISDIGGDSILAISTVDAGGIWALSWMATALPVTVMFFA